MNEKWLINMRIWTITLQHRGEPTPLSVQTSGVKNYFCVRKLVDC